MEKSPDAFRTISEVAETLETPAHVLRFWESRFPQIRPVKRAGGRRYYRPADVALLAGIKRLLHDEGMTIRGVQKILREQGVRHVAGTLDGVAVVDAYDILGLAEAAAQAELDEPETKVIELSAHVRGIGTNEATETDQSVGDADWSDMPDPDDDTIAAQSPDRNPAESDPAAYPETDPADALAGSVVLSDPDVAPLAAIPVDMTAASPMPEPVASRHASHRGWLPTRLRTLPRGALDADAVAIMPLAIRLADLRDRMALAARPGRG